MNVRRIVIGQVTDNDYTKAFPSAHTYLYPKMITLVNVWNRKRCLVAPPPSSPAAGAGASSIGTQHNQSMSCAGKVLGSGTDDAKSLTYKGMTIGENGD